MQPNLRNVPFVIYYKKVDAVLAIPSIICWNFTRDQQGISTDENGKEIPYHSSDLKIFMAGEFQNCITVEIPSRSKISRLLR